MAIKRAKRKTNFTIISNVGLRDPDLTLKAKGLLAYMLSLPDDWIFYESELVKHSIDGKASIRSGLKELEEKGYLLKEQERSSDGKFKNVDWVLHDEPWTGFRSTGKRSTDNPSTDKRSTENRTLLNTNSTKNLSKQNTDKTKENSRNSAKAKYADTSPCIIFAKEFFSEIKKNNPEAKEPNFQKWADDIRKAVQIDNRSIANLREVMLWSQQDDFWKGNILSAKKLREKYDQLKVQSGKHKQTRQYQNQLDWE